MLITKVPIGTIGIMGGVPSVLTPFYWSLVQMIQYNQEYVCRPGEIVYLDKATTSFHEAARNELAASMLGDWILMLDTDHEFEPDLLGRMLALTMRWRVDVLTGLYRYKEPPYLPNLFSWDDDSRSYTQIAEIDWEQPLQEIGCSGAGCLLVRREVFERIRAELGEEPFSIMPAPHDPKRNLSEDFAFFTRCRRLGISGYVAPRICCDHLRVKPITHQDYDRSAVTTKAVVREDRVRL